MSEVTFRAETWVWLEVVGEKTERCGLGVREDDGLTHRLMKWMIGEDIDWRAQRSGGGIFVGRIPVGDAPRVLAWLKEHGARPGATD